jgi:hypothetical protein
MIAVDPATMGLQIRANPCIQSLLPQQTGPAASGSSGPNSRPEMCLHPHFTTCASLSIAEATMTELYC